MTLNYSGTSVNEAVVYENGVKKTVRTYRWDGTQETEKTFDSTGTVTATQTHTSSENLKETVAPELINDQSGDDPLAFQARRLPVSVGIPGMHMCVFLRRTGGEE